MDLGNWLSSLVGVNSTTDVAPQSTFQATTNGMGQSNYAPSVATGGNAAAAGLTGLNNVGQQYTAMANGSGPSLAQLQLQQATQANNAAAASAAASARGLNPALAQRAIMQNQAANNQAAAGQSAQVRESEQLGALQGEAGAFGAQATGGAGLLQQAAKGQNDQNNTNLGVQQTNAQTADNNATLGQQAAAVNSGVASQNAKALGGTTTSLAKGIGGFLAMAGGGMVPSYDRGGRVPGEAQHPGNDPRNDDRPIMASPEEVMLPRTVSKDPDLAADFVRSLGKSEKGKGAEPSLASLLVELRGISKSIQKLQARA